MLRLFRIALRLRLTRFYVVRLYLRVALNRLIDFSGQGAFDLIYFAWASSSCLCSVYSICVNLRVCIQPRERIT